MQLDKIVATDAITSGISAALVEEPGIYKNEGIIGELSFKNGMYRPIMTYKTYRQYENQDGTKYWKAVSGNITSYGPYAAYSVL